MSKEHLKLAVTDLFKGRIDAFIHTQMKRSRSDIRGLFDHGCVVLNGEPCKDAGGIVEKGDLIEVWHDPARRYKELPRPYQTRLFKVVYEDLHLIVIDKEAGYLTVPNQDEKNTVLDAVETYFRFSKKGGSRAFVVHRLDRDTSGLLVFAKSKRIADQLIEQFKAHKPEREYAAIVAGKLKERQGVFESYLETDQSLNQKSVKRKSEGQLAITKFRVESFLKDTTYVRVNLETGKRNQIRVHFAEAGHPIIGDQRYGVPMSNHPSWRQKRLALHATILGFIHPVTQELLRFKAEIPPEFTKFLTPR